MTTDRKPCRAKECGQTVRADDKTGFCYACEATLRRDITVLQAEVGEALRLEAEFITWCQEHGQPHPHEE